MQTNFRFPNIFKMPSDNVIVLASAGSGKTTDIVNQACANGGRTALVTYTINGRNELLDKAYESRGAVPPHVAMLTWYTFVLTHLIRPYQNHLYEPRIIGINFNQMPDHARRIAKNRVDQFFFSSRGRLWRDRTTDFACRLIDKTGGLPIKRLEKIFQHLYIDEAQDLSGWDLELMEHLLKSTIKVTLVGDHRQATFSTNNNPKNKAYWGEKIIDKFEEWKNVGLADISHKAESQRCVQAICDFADKFFPKCQPTTSRNATVTDHDGVVLLRERDVKRYWDRFAPQPLRYDARTTVQYGAPLNFGESKGMTFERTLIYPTGGLRKYVKSGNLPDAGKSLAKIYVAVTRAKQSVAIVVPDSFNGGHLPIFEFPKENS